MVKMTLWDDATECPICGTDVPEDADTWWEAHEHPEAVVMTGDGWFGQYLASAFILDLHANVAPVPEDVLSAASAWYGSMGPSGTREPTEDDVDLVLDFVGNPADDLLAAHDMFVEWEDGFVVYKVQS